MTNVWELPGFSHDGGNGRTKGRGGSAGRSISFSSVLAQLDETLMLSTGLDKGAERFVIGFRGRKYVVGDSVHYEGLTPMTIAHRSRINTEYYLTLFAACMSELFGSSGDIQAVASLPPKAYDDRDQLRHVLAGNYEVVKYTDMGPRKLSLNLDANNLMIIPEGLGAICSLALDEQGRETDQAFLGQTVVGVVDVGTYTTDLLQFDQLRLVKRGVDTIQTAMHQVHERLRDLAAGYGVDMPLYRADHNLRTGYFTCAGDRVPITEDREIWFEDLAANIAASIRTTWNGGHDVEYILLAGGGAAYVEPYLSREFPHVQLISVRSEGNDNGTIPTFFLNAEGGYRFMQLQNRAKKQVLGGRKRNK